MYWMINFCVAAEGCFTSSTTCSLCSAPLSFVVSDDLKKVRASAKAKNGVNSGAHTFHFPAFGNTRTFGSS